MTCGWFNIQQLIQRIRRVHVTSSASTHALEQSPQIKKRMLAFSFSYLVHSTPLFLSLSHTESHVASSYFITKRYIDSKWLHGLYLNGRILVVIPATRRVTSTGQYRAISALPDLSSSSRSRRALFYGTLVLVTSNYALLTFAYMHTSSWERRAKNPQVHICGCRLYRLWLGG